jgi:hypothetical protein
MNEWLGSDQTEHTEEPSEFDATRHTPIQHSIQDIAKGLSITVSSVLLGEQRVFDRPGEASTSSIYFGIHSP